MNDCNCNEAGYSQLPSDNSWNRNCTTACALFACFLLGLALLIHTRTRYIGVTLLALCVVCVYRKNSILLHLPSSLITAQTRTTEFLDLNTYFPDHHLFEKDFAGIKAEVEQLLQKTKCGKDLSLTRDTYGGENAYIGKDVKVDGDVTTGWRVLNIKAGDTYSPYAKHFPTLRRVLRRVKGVAACVVSVLEPGVTIPIHVGYYKGVMRYMIPTHVPKERDKVFLCVNGIKYHWTEGKGVLWDDNFPHKVYNYSDEIRVVVYMDIIRPLPGWLGAFNTGMISMASNSSIVKKEVQRTEKQVKLK